MARGMLVAPLGQPIAPRRNSRTSAFQDAAVVHRHAADRRTLKRRWPSARARRTRALSNDAAGSHDSYQTFRSRWIGPWSNTLSRRQASELEVVDPRGRSIGVYC